jgi:hypothetical protein
MDNVIREYSFEGPCTFGRVLFLIAVSTLPARLPEVVTARKDWKRPIRPEDHF